MSALGKVSCLYSDAREQDSTGGNTDDRTALTQLNPNAVAFPKSVVCVRTSGFLGVWNVDSLICIRLLEHKYAPASANS